MKQVSWLARPRLLPLYYYGTWPLRKLGLQIARCFAKSPIMVLYYHRVADRSTNPWTISNRDFVRQIDWLSRHFDLISLGEAQRRLASGNNRTSAVCITFDDGYAENCDHALPLLIERRIPVTYFVASHFVLNNQPFPHDVARGEALSPNTVTQLRSLAADGIDIGAHTRSHADLGRLTRYDALWNEIAGSRADLEQMLGQAVRYFAFPYGQITNLSAAAVQVARDAEFAGVCSAYGGYNIPGCDPFHLQRIHGDPHLPRFKNWMMFDPRIALGVRRWPAVDSTYR